MTEQIQWSKSSDNTTTYLLNQPVRLPFPNRVSEKYKVYSNENDGTGIHHFLVEAYNEAGQQDYSTIINFQHGQLPETGHNGLLSTVLLEILITHLQSFLSGKFAEDEFTPQAVQKLKEAYLLLVAGSEEREARGVLGKHEK